MGRSQIAPKLHTRTAVLYTAVSSYCLHFEVLGTKYPTRKQKMDTPWRSLHSRRLPSDFKCHPQIVRRAAALRFESLGHDGRDERGYDCCSPRRHIDTITSFDLSCRCKTHLDAVPRGLEVTFYRDKVTRPRQTNPPKRRRLQLVCPLSMPFLEASWWTRECRKD